MTGLLDSLARRCRCHISDLSCRLDSVGSLAQEIGEMEYPLSEWAEAAAYLFAPEIPPPFASVAEAKAYFAVRRKRAPPPGPAPRRWRKKE